MNIDNIGLPDTERRVVVETMANGSTPFQHPMLKNHDNNRGLSQAYALRNLSAIQALVLNDMPANDIREASMKAGAIRDLVAVWSVASERIRILRGRPLPGSLKPKEPKRKRKVQTGPLFSMDDSDTPVRTDSPDPQSSTPTDVPQQP